jgi:succinate dehydrogenase / fumarate reductase cytochrome b subunit
MRRVAALYRSSVGKKVLMAVTGFIWIGFLLGHMAGNLKAFQGATAFDTYAAHLRTFGEPILPRMGFLWPFRVFMAAALVLHIWLAWQTSRQSWAARGTDYRKEKSLSFDFASRWMRWSGVLIGVFLVYHILNMTTGTLHANFMAEDVVHDRSYAYHNLVTGLSNPWVAAIYIAAMLTVLVHLWHGVWSMFQTLGAAHPKYARYRRPFAVFVAIVISLGFISIPVAILTGIVSM